MAKIDCSAMAMPNTGEARVMAESASVPSTGRLPAKSASVSEVSISMSRDAVAGME